MNNNDNHILKDALIVLRGRSGSGKDATSQILEEAWDIKQIPSYTDRPMRKGELDGREHIFLTPADYTAKNLYSRRMDDILAQTTANNGCRYMTLRSQVKGLCSVIFDDKGVEDALRAKENGLDITLLSILGDHLTDSPEDQARRDRDAKFFYLNNDVFDYTINNNGTLWELRIKVQEFMIDYVINTSGLRYKGC